MVSTVCETINFPSEEEKIIKFWEEIDAFQQCNKLSKGKPRYSFYDGPPFATGLPHYGHILAGTIKDIVTRYAFQNGYHVERRFGWDCHGLPVEFEIDKKLGIKGKEDVEKLGIAKYNEECRKIVMRYSKEWEDIVTRIGRWIDFKNDYKTLYPTFMESVWWVFSELWRKGLVYKGVKIMPYSTACTTPLSNFECGQNYKEVVDPAIVPKFQMKGCPETYLLAWTTTPWTLPSNLALCVNGEMQYIKLQEVSTKTCYIMTEARVCDYFKKVNDNTYSFKGEQFEVIDKFPGSKLEGEKYYPLFPYFKHLEETCFRILVDSYVTADSGTGIVHQSPYFGEDDFRVCLKFGLVTRDQEPVCPVDADGRFTSEVKHFAGKHVKDADKDIINHLKNENKIFSVSTVSHSYPFCWRSDTPLIYKAVSSWFIRVEQMSQELLQANSCTYWVPEFVKEKRFANWLKEARDWAVSRNRYWGTPIPLWVSEDMKEVVCISSINELEKLTNSKITDLHRESIDHLTIPSKREGFPPLKRIPEVFDCWFESGSMPYAQIHYPFENSKDFNQRFPADFIAEGIDQTRGWFYTLLVVSTALFNKPPFKNLIVNGLVLASDGQKMSKSKKNFPDPMNVVNKFGADALRLYLINSPVVRGDKLRFREEGVKDILKDVLLPWYNAYRFLIQNVQLAKLEKNITVCFDDEKIIPSNLMDRWILSFTQSLCNFVKKEMAAYRLYTVVPQLVKFIENLTNWYVRMNRRRLKGETTVDDCKNALCTLGSVLFVMIRLMAPYTPFLTEFIYQNLKLLTDKNEKSIHFIPVPQARENLIDEKIEKAVALMQDVIDLGRVIRDRKTIPIKYPLKEAVIILNSEEEIKEISVLENYIMEELNVRKITLSSDRSSYGVSLKADADFKTLGPRLKDKFKSVVQNIKALSESDIQSFSKTGSIMIDGEELTTGDLRIMLKFAGERASELSEKYEPNGNNNVVVLLDITPDEEMQAEGLAREIINRIQKLRKKAGLVPTDEISVYSKIIPDNCDVGIVAGKYQDYIQNAIKSPFHLNIPSDLTPLIEEKQHLKGASKEATITIAIVKSNTSECSKNISKIPSCKFVVVHLLGSEPSCGINGNTGTVLLENPVGHNVLTLKDLSEEVKILFGIYGKELELYNSNGEMLTEEKLKAMTNTLIYANPKGVKVEHKNTGSLPISQFVDIKLKDKRGALLLENPLGTIFPLTQEEKILRASKIFSINGHKGTSCKDIEFVY